jgi:hypothetical protein
MKEIIKRNLDGKKIAFLFILTNILYAIMLTITIPKVMAFAGGMKVLDMMAGGYDAAYVNTLLNDLGEEGRNAYLYNQMPLDFAYPFLFGITYCLLLAYILNKLGKSEKFLFYLCLIPLLSCVLDYAENIGIVTMLKSYPNNSVVLSLVTSVFTVLKSASTTLYFITLLVTLVALGMKRIAIRKIA